MTYQQLSEKSGVSLSTVERILTGKAKNSSFEVLRALTFALQGNLDDLSAAVDSTPGAHPETWGAGPELPSTPEGTRNIATSADINTMMVMFSDMLREKDENYERHIAALRERRKEDLASQRAEHARELESLRAEHAREIAAMVKAHDREREYKNRWITWLFSICLTLVVFLVFILVYDVLNPDVGWVRRIGAVLFGKAV